MDNADICPELLTILIEFGHKGCNRILKAKIFRPDSSLVEAHYQEHVGKHFFDALFNQLVDQIILVAVVEGPGVVNKWRARMGSFQKDQREPGTIRGDYMKADDPLWRNFVHGSDSSESAEREIALWFPELAKTA